MDVEESSPPSQPSPVDGGRGFLAGVLDLRLVQVKRVLMPCLVGEAVADQVLGCFHAVIDFDAWGFSAQGFCEEACNVFTVFGEADDVLL